MAGGPGSGGRGRSVRTPGHQSERPHPLGGRTQSGPRDGRCRGTEPSAIGAEQRAQPYPPCRLTHQSAVRPKAGIAAPCRRPARRPPQPARRPPTRRGGHWVGFPTSPTTDSRSRGRTTHSSAPMCWPGSNGYGHGRWSSLRICQLKPGRLWRAPADDSTPTAPRHRCLGRPLPVDRLPCPFGRDPFVPNYRLDGHCGKGRWSCGYRRPLVATRGRGGCCTPLLYSRHRRGSP